ncbi:MAG: creatininase family protein [Candidatus Zixiibacteriota bacterium]
MERRLHHLSWLKVRELVPATITTVILPVGTVEAHGSACLGTDIFIPEVIAGGIGERLNALVAPTVNYGITRSLYRYNGGCTIDEKTFGAYVGDILVSLADVGFRYVIIMNGHGGNNSALKTVAADFHRQHNSCVAVIHWWELCHDMTKEFFGHVGGHAGTDEAAVVHALDPSLLDKDAYDPKLAYYMRPGADIYPVPGTILLYQEGEGYPEFDLAKAKQYRDKLVQTVGDFAEMVLGRWRQAGF